MGSNLKDQSDTRSWFKYVQCGAGVEFSCTKLLVDDDGGNKTEITRTRRGFVLMEKTRRLQSELPIRGSALRS